MAVVPNPGSGASGKGSVLVAMSGGVDSSVAACLLKEAGYLVIGCHLRLLHGLGVDHGCCGPGAEADARAAAEAAGIPIRVVDLSEAFEEHVIAWGVAEYRAGRTPNPCVRCNERIRFGALLRLADVLGLDFVATGHYARTMLGPDGRWHLYRGVDPSKDQSYVLHLLGQEQLARASFPLGGLTKTQTRAQARRLGLPVADKPDSQDLCFLPQGDRAAFLEAYAPDLGREGDIVDQGGRILGRHRGLCRHTVGQRRGLGISTGHRSYVLDLDARANRVIVGSEDLLGRIGLIAGQVNWVAGRPEGPFEAEAQIRYRGEGAPALVSPQGEDGARVEFRAPQRAVTPGQSAVFYRGPEVVGGGTIRKALGRGAGRSNGSDCPRGPGRDGPRRAGRRSSSRAPGATGGSPGPGSPCQACTA